MIHFQVKINKFFMQIVANFESQKVHKMNANSLYKIGG